MAPAAPAATTHTMNKLLLHPAAKPLLFAIATIAFIVAAALELPPLCLPGLTLEGSARELLKLELLDSFYADDLTLFLADRAAFDKARRRRSATARSWCRRSAAPRGSSGTPSWARSRAS